MKTVRAPRFAVFLSLLVPILLGGRAEAQLRVVPSIGLQTMWLNGDYPASDDISPGKESSLQLGGGIMGSSNGLHLQADLVPDTTWRFRFPITFEAFHLVGATTYVGGRNGERLQYLRITNTANIFSFGAGVTATFHKSPDVYVSADARMNYIPPSELHSLRYHPDNDEVLADSLQHPDPNGETRVGAYLKVGTRVNFFGPLSLDFSVGYGAINLLGRNGNGLGRSLLTVDNQYHAPEITLGYIGFGLSVVWTGYRADEDEEENASTPLKAHPDTGHPAPSGN
ncbi:MAG: hypothetical protein JWQ98_3050 [Chlorobi bacterium]|nr:hypothetical protein [Chlorobiota bacterium]